MRVALPASLFRSQTVGRIGRGCADGNADSEENQPQELLRQQVYQLGNGCPDDLADSDLFFPPLGRKGGQPEKAEAGVFGTGQRVYGYCIIFPFILSKKDAL